VSQIPIFSTTGAFFHPFHPFSSFPFPPHSKVPPQTQQTNLSVYLVSTERFYQISVKRNLTSRSAVAERPRCRVG